MAVNGKIPATVTRVYDTYVLAMDAWACEYFILYTAVETMGRWGFPDLRIGSNVKLTPIEHPKGWRGIDVEIVEL
jgi:hypothetical protein